MDANQEQLILKKLDTIKDIPTLPTIVFELNKLLRNPDTSIKTVCDTIEKDQAITLKILKLVNSAFYGFKSKISDLRNAVVLPGYNALRNASVSLSVIHSFPKSAPIWPADGNCPWVWWMRFDGTMIFSRITRIQISCGTSIWPILSSMLMI